MNDYWWPTIEEWTEYFTEAYGHLPSIYVNVRDRGLAGMSRKINGRKSAIKRRTR